MCTVLNVCATRMTGVYKGSPGHFDDVGVMKAQDPSARAELRIGQVHNPECGASLALGSIL